MHHEWGSETKFFFSLHRKTQKKMKPCVAVPQHFTGIRLLLEKSLGFLNTTFIFD